ncbi:hypothetical protein ACC718_19690 [Rhizobium ruizarguesonis]
MKFYLGILFISFLSLTSSVSTAQAQYYSPYMAQPTFNTPGDAISAAKDREKELGTAATPKNDLAISRELDGLTQEINAAEILANNNAQNRDGDKRVFDAIDDLKTRAGKIKSLDCAGDPDGARAAWNSYSRQFQALRNLLIAFPDIPLDSFMPLPIQNINEALCQQLKDVFLKPNFDAEFGSAEGNIKAQLSKSLTDWAPVSSEYQNLVSLLKARKSSLQGSLNNSTPQKQISDMLPYILGVLGVSCICAIATIKLFDSQIQMEWVVSGQVIQFVTVMVLLSVITALGLSNILKENTLGTLLGGIAGYVLAQGVGRATARDVSRMVGSQAHFTPTTQTNDARKSPPPPNPPPDHPPSPDAPASL